MKKILFYLLLFGNIFPVYCQHSESGSQATLQSPDKNYTFSFYQKEGADHRRSMYYTVSYKGHHIINESLLDINMDNNLSEKAMALKVDTHRNWCENLKITGYKTGTYDSIWTPIAGEYKQITDRYNSLVIQTVKDDNPIYPMEIEVRAYDEGIAFRYFFPENAQGTYYNVTAENTEFSLPAGTKAWFANWGQAPYLKLPLKDWPGESERPLTLELPGGLFVVLTEAQMTDYARTKFKLSDTKPNTIMTSMFGGAQLTSPVGTPWRVIMVAEKAGDLIEHNSLILNLNPPSRIHDTSWIRPGKQIRIMTMSKAGAKQNVDFAVQQGLQYILLDWKWYGPPFSFSSDATKVAIPDLDLPEVIRYAKEKGIGVWLYVNKQAMLAQADSLFSIYRKWGVDGVKLGFVQVGSHRWTTWTADMIKKAAEHRLMLNIHDDWRPTGEQRTWPNLMTAEGIRGNEEMPDATHNTVLPFTRFIAGPADYTICYFNKRIKTTHAHQLALAAIYFSPLQTLFWYDNPSDYHNEPELKFWKEIPTTWDTTLVLQGAPGEYIITARRKGQSWFLGAITNNEKRDIEIPLTFLQSGKKYTAYIYADDPSVKTATHVGITQKTVSSTTVLNQHLLPSGGVAIQFRIDE